MSKGEVVMKNKLLFFIVALLVFVLSGCVSGSVGDDVVVNDVLTEFQNEYQKIENVEILESEKTEKAQNVYVSFNIINQEFEGNRYYQLLYNYYDRGGWMLDSVQPYLSDKWQTHPIKGYKTSKEMIAAELFNNMADKGERGFVLKGEIRDSFFNEWTRLADSKEKNPAEYITDVEYSESLDENLSYALVTIEAESYVLRIKERIRLTYKFSEEYMGWELIDRQSVEHTLRTVKPVEGTYQKVYNKDTYMFTINNVSSDGYITGTLETRTMWSGEQEISKQEYKYRVNSVYNSNCECLKYHHSNHNSTSNLQFYKDCFTTGYGGGVVGTEYEYLCKIN